MDISIRICIAIPYLCKIKLSTKLLLSKRHRQEAILPLTRRCKNIRMQHVQQAQPILKLAPHLALQRHIKARSYHLLALYYLIHRQTPLQVGQKKKLKNKRLQPVHSFHSLIVITTEAILAQICPIYLEELYTHLI